MANLGTIRLAILRRLQDANAVSLLSSDVVVAINEAINHYKDQAFKFNYIQDTATITAGTNVIPTPADYLSPIGKDGAFAVMDSNCNYPLKYISNLEYDEYVSTEEERRPFAYSFVNNAYICMPKADKDYTVKRYYLQDMATLVNDSDSNAFTLNAETMIRNYALANLTAEFQQDEKMSAYYFDKAQSDFDKLVKLNNDTLSVGRNKTYVKLY